MTSGLWRGFVPAVGSLLLVEIVPPGLRASAIIPQRLNGPVLKGSVFHFNIEAPGRAIAK